MASFHSRSVSRDMSGEQTGSAGSANDASDLSRDEGVLENKALVSDRQKTYDTGGALAASRDVDGKGIEGAGAGRSEGAGRCRCCPASVTRFCVAPVAFCGMFYFSFVGAYGCVLPYVSIYMKQIGLSPQQIGLISGLRPIVAFCSAPLWGALGDHLNIRRPLLIVSLLSWLAFFVALFHIPPPEMAASCPTDIVVVQRRYNAPFLHRRILADGSDNGDDNDDNDDDDASGSIEFVRGQIEDETSTVAYRTPDEIEAMTMYRGWMYDPESVWRVFVTCLSLIVAGEVFQSPTSALSDTGTLHTLETEGLTLDSYGYVRAWGALGYGISSFVSGALVSSSREKEVLCGVELYFSDYRLLTYVFIAFIVVSFVAATQINFKEGRNGEELELTKEKRRRDSDCPVSEKTHNAGAVIRIFFNVHYGSWLATSFFVGICNGVIWGFLYWHLDNLGASQLLMGVSGIVVCLSEFVMFFLVGKVVKLLGHIGIMYLGLVGYALRFCIYAVITNPWWVLPAEVLQGITFSIVWVSMTAYTTMAVPSTSLATIQGILHGVYFGLGSGSGHLIGGIMIGYVGAVITFFSFAGASLIALMLFFIAQKCSSKPDDVYSYTDLDEETDKTTTVDDDHEPPSHSEQEKASDQKAD